MPTTDNRRAFRQGRLQSRISAISSSSLAPPPWEVVAEAAHAPDVAELAPGLENELDVALLEPQDLQVPGERDGRWPGERRGLVARDGSGRRRRGGAAPSVGSTRSRRDITPRQRLTFQRRVCGIQLLYELAADLAGARHAVRVNVVREIRRPVVVRVASIRGH